MKTAALLTIDANVFISAIVRQEVHHADSLALLQKLSDGPASAVCPTLVIVETVAGIARPTGNEDLARQGRILIEEFPGIRLQAPGLHLIRHAAEIAASHRLRGADAVYLAVAQIHRTTLITWDKEMLQRGPDVAPTVTPAQWLHANAA